MSELLFPALADPTDREALRFGDSSMTYRELSDAASAVAAGLAGMRRVAVWAHPTIDTCVAVVGALLAGVPIVPINPKIGERELAHILSDSAPDLVLDRDFVTGVAIDLPEPDAEAPALIIYTSGTTGPPKGVVLPRRALASNLDALAAAWEWTDDVVVHALPLFHVHGLGVGVLGPLRRGGTVHHLGKFSVAAASAALRGGGMMFGVPTMYGRIATEVEAHPSLAEGFRQARLLVSGSAALPATVHERITRATGRQVIERYGMTETLMNTSVRCSGDRRPGTVGLPLDGVDVRLAADGRLLSSGDGEIGEIEVRGPNLFLEYLNRPDATAEAFRDGWFQTGDMAVRDPDGYLRIVGRRATDLIKSGGYKIGAGEIENALLEHSGVAEVAVTGEPDDDLGERIVAWVVAAGEPPSAAELSDHVARLLSPHKRPRVVRFVAALPRNEMGKVLKRSLRA